MRIKITLDKYMQLQGHGQQRVFAYLKEKGMKPSTASMRIDNVKNTVVFTGEAKAKPKAKKAKKAAAILTFPAAPPFNDGKGRIKEEIEAYALKHYGVNLNTSTMTRADMVKAVNELARGAK